MKLSIIIPCYNAVPYINELLSVLNDQIKDTEVIIVDDGSDEPFSTNYIWAKVIRQDNAGVSAARNRGLDEAVGDYVAFIDADDLVSENYISTILNKIEETHFDYCYLSWKTIGDGWKCDVKLKTIKDKFPSFNLCVWNRVYRRAFIGETRFNPVKLIAEDAEFIKEVDESKGSKAFISDYMYYYRSDTPDSLTKKFEKGLVNTKRVVYYYPRVTKGMEYLIDEFKEVNKTAEIILMTNQNEIPELAMYSMVLKPTRISGTDIRGNNTPLFNKIYLPIKTQVVIWTGKTYKIGGIETFIYNFCLAMSKYYDILVLYEVIDDKQLKRLQNIVRCEKRKDIQKIECDTIIVNRISDSVPSNIIFSKKIQMCHTCKIIDNWSVPHGDVNVYVSQVAADSFHVDTPTVIHNLMPADISNKYDRRSLILVTASRLDTFEKGKNRIAKLASLFSANNIPYIWFVFSETKLEISNVISLPPTLDILPYIRCADYLVQLSDSESFCYSIVESLCVGTPVITTPLAILDEIGFHDNVNGYIIPFEITGADVEKIYQQIPKFHYTYDNDSVIDQWRGVLGDTKPKGGYIPPKKKTVKILKNYFDLDLGCTLIKGQIVEMDDNRIKELKNRGFVALA